MKRVITYVESAGGGSGGAWGAVLTHKSKSRRMWGGGRNRSAPELILQGAYEVLQALREPCAVELVSSSQYLVKGMTQWLPRWQKQDWHGANGPVAHREAWEALVKAADGHEVQWTWMAQGTAGQWQAKARHLAKQMLDASGTNSNPGQWENINPFLPLIRGRQRAA